MKTLKFMTVYLLLSGPLIAAGNKVLLRGHIVCVDESGSETVCGDRSRQFSLKTEEGRRFLFAENDSATGIFEDTRVRERKLQIEGWVGQDGRLEIVKVYAIRGGELFDIHYFCQTCNIKAFVGGLCWCCQEEFEFRETPVRADN